MMSATQTTDRDSSRIAYQLPQPGGVLPNMSPRGSTRSTWMVTGTGDR